MNLEFFQFTISDLKKLNEKKKVDVREIINHKSAIINILWWAIVSIISIVVVEINALLGFGVAIVGGIILGIMLFAK